MSDVSQATIKLLVYRTNLTEEEVQGGHSRMFEYEDLDIAEKHDQATAFIQNEMKNKTKNTNK